MDDLTCLPDNDLHEHALGLARNERSTVVELISTLREIDARRLFLARGYSSLFVYCREALRLSESAAYARIEVARASRAFPQLLEGLRAGELNPTTAMLLAPHLRADNVRELLDASRFKSRRDVERVIASVRPLPDAKAIVRREPKPAVAPRAARLLEDAEHLPVEPPPTPIPLPRPAVVVPLAPARYKIQFTADEDTHQKLRHAQNLLRHQVPTGDLCTIVKRALTLLIEEVERTKLGMGRNPRANARPVRDGSRHIPMNVRREIWRRDGGQCAFVGADGRCRERAPLEFHHVRPFAAGGKATADNLELRCRAHNVYEGALFFGADAMARRAH